MLQPSVGVGRKVRIVAVVTEAGPGDVALGGTRRDPTLGDTAVSDGTTLATLTLLGVAPGPARVWVERVVARRSDASYVAVSGESGTLSLVEEAP